VENLSEVQTQAQSQLPPIADLMDQVQLTYWSNHHFIAQVLLDQLPFGEILGSYRFYQYVDYQLPSLLEAARRNLLYWILADIRQYNRTPADQISLFYNETFLWHYSALAFREEIITQIWQGNRVRFLSQFLLSQTQVEVEFNEIRLLTTGPIRYQFIYTDSKEYSYSFNTALWETTIQNHKFALINPTQYTLPITQPNTQGREPEYQAQLTRIQALPNNIHIQAHYWDSVDTTPDITLEGTTWASTPLSEYQQAREFQFASPATAINCGCGINICHCNNNWQPGTPPTPSYLLLWDPQVTSQPLDSVHYNQQTGA